MESLETTGTTKEAEDVKRAERNDAINLTAKQSFMSERQRDELPESESESERKVCCKSGTSMGVGMRELSRL